MAEQPEPTDESFAEDLLRNLNEQYVLPELEQRIADDAEVGPVFAFMVLFDAPADHVFINGEIPGSFAVKPARDLKAGEAVGVDDFDELSDFVPNEDISDAQFIVGLQVKNGWGLKLKFGRTNPEAAAHFERANAFLESARAALHNDAIEVFVDNAFSAAELFAKSELLSYEITAEALGDSRRHGRVSSTHGLWTKLDNSNREFTRVLNELSEARGPARYLNGELAIGPDRAQEILVLLDQMRDEIRPVVEGTDPTNTLWMYATRPIGRGEILRPGDVTIIPPKPDSA